jgi:hypothetical protein
VSPILGRGICGKLEICDFWAFIENNPVMKYFITFAFLTAFSTGYAQLFDVGAYSATGVSGKLEGRIMLNDTVYVFNSAGKEIKRTIQNKTENDVYVTDGTAVDKLSIALMSGKVKGFSYTHVITYQADTRFNQAGPILYYCRQR